MDFMQFVKLCPSYYILTYCKTLSFIKCNPIDRTTFSCKVLLESGSVFVKSKGNNLMAYVISCN